MPVALERPIQVTVVHDFLQEGREVAEELGTFRIIGRMCRSWPGPRVAMIFGRLHAAVENVDVPGAAQAINEMEDALHYVPLSYKKGEEDQLGTDLAAIAAVASGLKLECDKRAREISPGRERDLIEG